MPSIRRAAPVVLLALALLVLVSASVNLAFEGAEGDPSAADVPTPLRVATNLVATLFFGSLALATVPRYVESVVDRTTAGFLRSLLWGVGVNVVAFVVLFVLALTGVGLVVAIPLGFAFVVASGVGTALGYLSLLDGRVPDRRVALVVGAAVAAVSAAVPLVGQAVAAVVGAIGLGGMAIEHAD